MFPSGNYHEASEILYAVVIPKSLTQIKERPVRALNRHEDLNYLQKTYLYISKCCVFPVTLETPSILFWDTAKVLQTEEGILEFTTTQCENTRGDGPVGWYSWKMNLPHPIGTTVPAWLVAELTPGAF